MLRDVASAYANVLGVIPEDAEIGNTDVEAHLTAADTYVNAYTRVAPIGYLPPNPTDVGPQMRADAALAFEGGGVTSEQAHLSKTMDDLTTLKPDANTITKSTGYIEPTPGASRAGVYLLPDGPEDRMLAHGASRRQKFVADRQAGRKALFQPVGGEPERLLPRKRDFKGDGLLKGLRRGDMSLADPSQPIMGQAKPEAFKTTEVYKRGLRAQSPITAADIAQLDKKVGAMSDKGLRGQQIVDYVIKEDPRMADHIVPSSDVKAPHFGADKGGTLRTTMPNTRSAKLTKGLVGGLRVLGPVGAGFDLFEAGKDLGRGNILASVGHLGDAVAGASMVGDVANLAANFGLLDEIPGLGLFAKDSDMSREGIGSALVESVAGLFGIKPDDDRGWAW
jgi:hypothetical protein